MRCRDLHTVGHRHAATTRLMQIERVKWVAAARRQRQLRRVLPVVTIGPMSGNAHLVKVGPRLAAGRHRRRRAVAGFVLVLSLVATACGARVPPYLVSGSTGGTTGLPSSSAPGVTSGSTPGTGTQTNPNTTGSGGQTTGPS